MKKTIGIIGGMGPLATADLFKKIITITPAKSDNEHIRVVIDNNTNIPDRTAAILGKGKDPVSEMVRSAVSLENIGADLLIMPCNTAHYFYERITPFVKIPFINMLEETAKEIKAKGIGKVGLLATSGTISSGVYSKMFEKYRIKELHPVGCDQDEVMRIIYDGVKAGNYALDISGFLKVVDSLIAQGAEYLVLGCTELPIAFEMFNIKADTIDPTMILAQAAVKMALSE